ncbi:putative colanic acid biosynthesis acetyltransferase [Mucilaginibacter sp. E4BP6]|uniref:putative colanic acid biosynthesis acetyltransferase n=1 Tax=Mucilaginibacter sp. E4BP6 TaxID=2723089 RepID=UPI0015CE8916|nr:putative colanic acid biosynthesis acetyltransferase [Mucilaginibacter sp. E4BP6]NYE68275.1 putative colanic acid biosynthesis acetyltransferase WcaF [Mucilaginibacter sp. E4BP6]
MFSNHQHDSQDALLRPVFSFKDKLRRFTWNITWFVFCKWTPNPMHKWRISVLRLFGAKIGDKNFIYPNCKIWAPWLLQTDDVVTIGSGVEVYNPGGVVIGHHAILSQDAFICGATHDYNTSDFTYIKKQITIDAHVWICARAVVLPGVHCKEGSVLGAAAVISKDMEPWTVYAGNPAKEITKRENFLIRKAVSSL